MLVHQRVNRGTCQILVVAVGRRYVPVLRVEPRDRWWWVTLSPTKQHRVGALEVQHHGRPHVDVRRLTSALYAFTLMRLIRLAFHDDADPVAGGPVRTSP